MQGKIMKGVGGLYTVQAADALYQCRAKGIFRKRSEKPLPGDTVLFEITSEADSEGNITELLPRKNRLIRPEIANVDQIFLLFAVKEPQPNFDMLNKYLIMMKDLEIPVSLVVTKMDQAESDEEERIKDLFINTGYSIFFISLRSGYGLEELKNAMKGRTTAFAGPSGVGKSSLLNHLFDADIMETGSLSKKIQRGKNTTRHSEIFFLEKDTFVFDTPGFTSVDVSMVEPDNLQVYFPEFEAYLGKCRFNSCKHLKEPDCAVKEAVRSGQISRQRYRIYASVYEELKNIRRY